MNWLFGLCHNYRCYIVAGWIINYPSFVSGCCRDMMALLGSEAQTHKITTHRSVTGGGVKKTSNLCDAIYELIFIVRWQFFFNFQSSCVKDSPMPLGELCKSFLQTRGFPKDLNLVNLVNNKNGSSEKCYRPIPNGKGWCEIQKSGIKVKYSGFYVTPVYHKWWVSPSPLLFE